LLTARLKLLYAQRLLSWGYFLKEKKKRKKRKKEKRKRKKEKKKDR
jgi:hypothetical protein